MRHYRDDEYRLASINYSGKQPVVVAFDVKDRISLDQIGARVNCFEFGQALPVRLLCDRVPGLQRAFCIFMHRGEVADAFEANHIHRRREVALSLDSERS